MTAGFAYEAIIAFAEYMEALLLEAAYNNMVESVETYWDTVLYGGNEGQISIGEQFVIPYGEDIMAGWSEDFPEVDPEDYTDCLDAHEAGHDCWSETVEDIIPIITGYVIAGYAIQAAAEAIQAYAGEKEEEEAE